MNEFTITPEGKERLEKLINFVDNLTPSQFNFNAWVEKRDGTGCATIACAWGWAPNVFPDEVRPGLDDRKEFNAPQTIDPSIGRMKFMGVDGFVDDALFLSGELEDPEDGANLLAEMAQPATNKAWAIFAREVLAKLEVTP